jgi:RHS repeat-associated protein
VGTTTYTYDGRGQQIKRVTSTGHTTVYIGGRYEAAYNASGAQTGTTKYYEFGGRNVAVRQGAGSGTLSFLLADHLGSTVEVLNGAGATVSEQRYWPFGRLRSGSVLGATDRQFTGQQREINDALQLYDYKARFYSTVTGRFLSVDPLMGSGNDPQSWNAYSYVRNNPLRLVDPSGMRWEDGNTPNTSGARHRPGGGGHAARTEALRQGMIAGAIFAALRQIEADRQARVIQAWAAGQTHSGSGQAIGNSGSEALALTVALVAATSASPLPIADEAVALAAFGTVYCYYNDCNVLQGGAQLAKDVWSKLVSRENSGETKGSRTPVRGDPNSFRVFPNKNGTGTARIYGPDGRALRDVDYHQDHGPGNPHVHDWDWSTGEPIRQPGRALEDGEFEEILGEASND